MNKDQAEGKLDRAKGTVKEKAGSAVGNESLEAEGKADKAEGKIQETFGDLKDAATDALDSVKKKIKGA